MFINPSINDWHVGYGRSPRHQSVIGWGVFSDLIAGVFSSTTKEKIGKISDVLTDRTGAVRYFVVELGDLPYYSRKVLLPGERAYINSVENRVYAAGLSKQQVEQFPPFDGANDRQSIFNN